MPRVVCAPDKFRGTATAAQVADAMAAGAWEAGWDADQVPMSDGGEGFLDVLGGPNRTTRVTGPLGGPVEAEWRLQGPTAVIEMARAAGLDVAGGREGNDPMRASTAGVGELIVTAVQSGAKHVLVGLGGSASTDGGLGCLEAIGSPGRLKGVRVEVACDVAIPFVEAAERFAPQKGATAAQVALLTRRLEQLAERYWSEHGVDVLHLEGAGAAGGLAGGLAAWGATLVPGFELVAEEANLAGLADGAAALLTGEGYLDDQSFAGKVVGGAAELASSLGMPCGVVAGDADPLAPLLHGSKVVSLVERFGDEQARTETLRCVREATRELLEGWS